MMPTEMSDEHEAQVPTVIVAQENRSLRGALRRLLEENGYRVVAPEEPPRLTWETQEHSVLVVDLDKPTHAEWEGRGVAAPARHPRSTLRTVYLSSQFTESVLREGLIAPGVALVSKPVEDDSLTRTIATLLNETGPVDVEVTEPAAA